MNSATETDDNEFRLYYKQCNIELRMSSFVAQHYHILCDKSLTMQVAIRLTCFAKLEHNLVPIRDTSNKRST